MVTNTRKISVSEFEAMTADPGHRYELVDGELIDMDGAPPHGKVTGEIYLLIRLHLRETGLPLEAGVSTGFRMNPYTLRFPAVHVTTVVRMAAYDASAGGWPHFAPDVAIEVVSPSNTPSALNRKATEYFANGAAAMWIADPGPRSVVVWRPSVDDVVFGPEDTLSGDPEIPGCSCVVADIFAVLDRAGSPAPEDT